MLPNLGEQLADRALECWMQEQRVEFAQWHEDEPSLMQARMWHYEIRLVDHPLAVKQHIKIDGPGARSIILITAESMFDFP